MIEKILKLRRARRALEAGQIEEALRLVDDPDVRGHLKAERLRERCVRALRSRAAELERRGDLTHAADELEKAARAIRADDPADSARRVRERAAERNEREATARAKLFQARTHLDRGDLAAADRLVRDVEGDEARALRESIARRRGEAQRDLEAARAVTDPDPARAAELLGRAAAADPAVAGLEAALLSLERTRIARACAGGLTDGALTAFLLEHGLFMQRRLADLDASRREELEAPLQELVARRAWSAIESGALAAAARLLERRREHLCPHPELDAIERGTAALAAVKTRIEDGELERAEAELADCDARLAATEAHRSALESLSCARARHDAGIEAARTALGEGRLLVAKSALLDVAETSPRSPVVAKLLDAVHDRSRRQREKLDDVRRLLDAGRAAEAAAQIAALEPLDAHEAEAALLRREAEIAMRAASTTASGRPITRPRASTSREAAGDGADLVLAIEEWGELLIPGGDVFVIGSEVRGQADLGIMATLAARHAEVVRKTSFHGGARWLVRALPGAEVSVGDEKVQERELAANDRIRLGRDVVLEVRTGERAGALLLLFPPGLRPSGFSGVALLPAIGRAGALAIGDGPDAHLRVHGATGLLEIHRERGMPGLAFQSLAGVRLDEDAARPKVEGVRTGLIRAANVRATLAGR